MEALLNLSKKILEYCKEFKAAGIIQIISDFFAGLGGTVQPR